MRSKLGPYHSKRDFSKTPEPSGVSRKSIKTSGKTSTKTPVKTPTRSAGQLRFVVQKHAARRLHYDFRLELDGVFKSWAVTRGPSLDPADKRLAVEVEDHPLEYGDFEGVIPAGQYGGGTVQIWDRGYWQPQASPASSGLKQGELKFSLSGQRLNGSWALIRMKDKSNRGQRHNWLLIKHRDTASNDKSHPKSSSDDLASLDTSVASGRTMDQISAGAPPLPAPFITAVKGRSKSSAAKQSHAVTPSRKQSMLPDFIEPELCKLVIHAQQGEEWLHEMKLDGYRLQLRVNQGTATLKTRSGLDWTKKFPTIARHAASLPSCIIDGEVVALDHQGNPDFGALQASLAEGQTDTLIFFAFDLLHLEEQDLRRSPLVERKQQLEQLLLKNNGGKDTAIGTLRYVEHIIGNGAAVRDAACRRGMEGVISKRCNSLYLSGRVGDWVKLKCRAGHEVIIGGMSLADGQVRSLLVGVMHQGKLVYTGRVGTGFSEPVRRQIMPQLKARMIKSNPFHGATAPPHEAGITWLRPTLVAEIEFAGWTKSGMIRQAAFKGLREDKAAAEVTAELPDDATMATMPISSRSTRKTSPQKHSGAVSASTFSLTHPDKILWPAQGDTPGVTKLDLAQYYHQVSDWLLPHVQGRPCSVVRAPDGIAGEHFFQRHATSNSLSALRTLKMTGDHKPYLMIDSLDALTALAQWGAVELHPGNGMPGDPEVPGRLVFDLDPGSGVDFNAVVTAALELRERLEQLNLHSFCKTSGGKGLHVVVPLSRARTNKRNAQLTWSNAKLFSKLLCTQMAADSPQRYIVKMAKASRTGRIYLDYLRNDRLATAVAPLSPRARAGAPVSMPLTWSQVRAGLNPQRFTLENAWTLLRKSQAWHDYADGSSSLQGIIKTLSKQYSLVA